MRVQGVPEDLGPPYHPSLPVDLLPPSLLALGLLSAQAVLDLLSSPVVRLLPSPSGLDLLSLRVVLVLLSPPVVRLLQFPAALDLLSHPVVLVLHRLRPVQRLVEKDVNRIII